MNKKVFVLGDSRTGTISLHKLLMDYGYNSIHYFKKEIEGIKYKYGCMEIEYSHFKEFIDRSGFDAFSDYPTRNYFRELRCDYQNAYFILSTRKDVQTWQNSMKRYFCDRPDVINNIEQLSRVHISLNNQIRELYRTAKHFLEINIDMGSDFNSQLISEFLEVNEELPLMKLNASN